MKGEKKTTYYISYLGGVYHLWKKGKRLSIIQKPTKWQIERYLKINSTGPYELKTVLMFPPEQKENPPS